MIGIKTSFLSAAFLIPGASLRPCFADKNNNNNDNNSNKYAAHLHSFVRALPQDDCFYDESTFAEACCSNDTGDLSPWMVEVGVTFHRCCKHLLQNCAEHAALVPLISELSADADLELLCWSNNNTWNQNNNNNDNNNNDNNDDDNNSNNHAWMLLSWEHPVSRERCCDTSLSKRGAEECWEHPPLSYEVCCGPAWISRRKDGCRAELLAEVDEYLDANSNLTFKEFWRSDAYTALFRIVRQVLLGRDSNRPNDSDVPCVFAFILTRILAFSKAPWPVQVEAISKLELPQSFQPVSRSEREINLAWKLLVEMPLHHLVSGSHFSVPLLSKVIRHRRKLRNYLAPDALAFPDTATFPVTDVGLTPQAEVFLQSLQYALHRSSFTSRHEVTAFIADATRQFHSAVRNSLSQAFSLVVAHIALAHAILREGGTGRVQRLEALTELQTADGLFRGFKYLQVNPGQRLPESNLEFLLHEWRSGGDYMHLLFSTWPFWEVLLAVAQLLAEPP
ncbi:unnamed protein product, partial [Polarella glacialis]